MSEQIIVRFGRSRDPRTDYYNIYRSATRDVGRHSPRVMKVLQPVAESPVSIQETLSEADVAAYQLTNKPVLLEAGFTVRVGGVPLPAEAYDVDPERGMVFLAQATDEPVDVDYFFDGIEVVDDRTANDPELVEHYGPALGNPNPPPPPGNASLLPTAEGMRINYEIAPTPGMYFYYAIEAVSNDGSRSALSVPLEVHMGNDILTIVLERYLAAWGWKSTEYEGRTPYIVDTKADSEPPDALSGFVAERDTSGVTFSWDMPLSNGDPRPSPLYRVRVRGRDGQLSEPSRTLGPELFQVELHEVAIYQRDGSLGPPLHTDSNATKVASLPVVNSGSYRIDLPTGYYAFSVYVVDKAGNHSLARTALVEMHDTP